MTRATTSSKLVMVAILQEHYSYVLISMTVILQCVSRTEPPFSSYLRVCVNKVWMGVDISIEEVGHWIL